MPSREIHHLGDLGFGHFETEHADHSQAFLVDGQHQLECLRMVHPEETFKYMNDVLHRGIVIVQQHDLIKRRLVRLWLCLGQKIGFAVGLVTAVIIVLIRHHMQLERVHEHLYEGFVSRVMNIGVRAG